MPGFKVLDSGLSTYSVELGGQAPAAGATDWFVLQCPAGSKVKIRYLRIGGTAVAARQQILAAFRRIAPNTGGTSSSPTPYPVDPTDGPAQAVPFIYSANITGAGTSTGASIYRSFALVAPGAVQDAAVMDWRPQGAKAPTFGMNITDYLCVSLGFTPTLATDKLDISCIWTEGG